MNIDASTPWFRAKRYGWGWGLPLTWQGWLVLVGYILLVGASAMYFALQQKFIAFGASFMLLTAALIVVCWLTGEKPRWRWGGN